MTRYPRRITRRMRSRETRIATTARRVRRGVARVGIHLVVSRVDGTAERYSAVAGDQGKTPASPRAAAGDQTAE